MTTLPTLSTRSLHSCLSRSISMMSPPRLTISAMRRTERRVGSKFHPWSSGVFCRYAMTRGRKEGVPGFGRDIIDVSRSCCSTATAQDLGISRR